MKHDLTMWDVAAASVTWPVVLPLAVGVVVAWAAGHVAVHLTVRALAASMDMTSRAGHRRYFRRGEDYRGRYSR